MLAHFPEQRLVIEPRFLAEIEKGYNSTSFFFSATIDKVNVSGFYSTYFKEAKNHFE